MGAGLLTNFDDGKIYVETLDERISFDKDGIAKGEILLLPLDFFDYFGENSYVVKVVQTTDSMVLNDLP